MIVAPLGPVQSKSYCSPVGIAADTVLDAADLVIAAAVDKLVDIFGRDQVIGSAQRRPSTGERQGGPSVELDQTAVAVGPSAAGVMLAVAEAPAVAAGVEAPAGLLEIAATFAVAVAAVVVHTASAGHPSLRMAVAMGDIVLVYAFEDSVVRNDVGYAAVAGQWLVGPFAR